MYFMSSLHRIPVWPTAYKQLFAVPYGNQCLVVGAFHNTYTFLLSNINYIYLGLNVAFDTV